MNFMKNTRMMPSQERSEFFFLVFVFELPGVVIHHGYLCIVQHELSKCVLFVEGFFPVKQFKLFDRSSQSFLSFTNAQTLLKWGITFANSRLASYLSGIS